MLALLLTKEKAAVVWLQAGKSLDRFIFCAISDLYNLLICCLPIAGLGRGFVWVEDCWDAWGIVWSVFYGNKRKIILNVSQCIMP